jgi:protein-tyrosine-phosphatase
MKRRVLVVCSGNSARSQMAEALLRHEAGDVFEVSSAGTHPAQVHIEAVVVMQELGIDISAPRIAKTADPRIANLFTESACITQPPLSRRSQAETINSVAASPTNQTTY